LQNSCNVTAKRIETVMVYYGLQYVQIIVAGNLQFLLQQVCGTVAGCCRDVQKSHFPIVFSSHPQKMEKNSQQTQEEKRSCLSTQPVDNQNKSVTKKGSAEGILGNAVALKYFKMLRPMFL